MAAPSSISWREAARRALAGLPSAVAPGVGEAAVERAVFDVTVAGRTEMVTVVLRDASLLCTTTEGQHDGPFVRAVLRLIAGGEPTAEPFVEPGSTSQPHIVVTELQGASRVAGSATRTLETTDQPASADRAALASALEDVITAVVRIGVRDAESSPTVEETIARLVSAAPSPVPLGIGRWIGRLRSALTERDVDTVARVLDGASRVAADLKVGGPDGDALLRIVSWLGATGDTVGDVEPIFDRVLIEIAREWLPGFERADIERRYLVDANDGEVFREERAKGAPVASVGPCPRRVSVGFAEAERGARPRRIRLLQYAVSAIVDDEDWAHVASAAQRSFRAVAAEYRSALEAFPGLAEPFALIAPASYERNQGLVPVDVEGWPLPIARADDPGGVAALESFATAPTWMAGRLVDAEGRLMLLPCSVARMVDGETVLTRIR